MKKLLSLCLCVMCLFASMSAFSANDGYDTSKIEQIYSKMPEIKAYVQLSEPVGDKEITAFLNSDELTLAGHAPFNRADGVSFVFMVDCSGSVSSSQMKKIKSSLTEFINNNAYTNDKYTVVSFGEKIDILTDGKSTGAEAVTAINSLKNNQSTTVLYDAVDALRQISNKADDTYPKKRMCVMFTDAVNDNVGGTTKNEVLEAAQAAGTPLYAVAINPNDKNSIDSLGAVARASGGELCAATGGNIKAAFEKALKYLDTVYEISFISATNKASLGESNLSICIGEKTSGNTIERKFMSTAWSADVEAPYIVSAEPVSDKEIRVVFSEQVENAGKIENYTVKKGTDTFKIKNVNYDSANHSAVLGFENYIGSGNYIIKTTNITDDSMEKNQIADAYGFEVSGFGPFIANLKNFGSDNGGWLLAVLITLIIAFVAYAVIKKRKGIVMIDNKATFGDNVQYEPQAPKSLPTHYLKLTMETADGNITNLDINIVQSIIFGRAKSCEVTIDDESLSRQHFAIELEDDVLFIQNLSQTNGTLLNGVPLGSKRKLALGDIISAGQERFTVSKI